MARELRTETAALRVSRGHRLTRGRPFGRCGLVFADGDPVVLLRAEIGDEVATALLNERELVVEELDAPPATAAPEPARVPMPAPVPVTRRSSKKTKKRGS